MSCIKDLAKSLGVSEEELKRMSREMGCESGAIPQYSGSRQMTTLAGDFANAGVYPDLPEVVEAIDAYEQKRSGSAILTEQQQAQVAGIEFVANTREADYYNSKVRGRANVYHALGRRVREQNSGR